MLFFKQNSRFTLILPLISSQEEAETKLVLHTKVSLEKTNEGTDIAIFVISLLWKFKERVILGDGHGKSRKKFSISDEDMESDIVDALIRLHNFLGNDYISSFFHKGINICFKAMIPISRFLNMFKTLRGNWEIVANYVTKLRNKLKSRFLKGCIKYGKFFILKILPKALKSL